MLRLAPGSVKRTALRPSLPGENLGQVASQTLANLAVISDATTIPVLRPLVTYDKSETVDLARRSGHFSGNRATLPAVRAEDCRQPQQLREAVREAEEKMDLPGLLDAVLASVEYVSAENGKILPKI